MSDSLIWREIEKLSSEIIEKISSSGVPIKKHQLRKFDWENHIFWSDDYRRAHIEIVDHRESHGLYIVHTTIFPHSDDPSPIWGFDAVCGKNKISGAFHDFSITGDSDHPMYKWWENRSGSYQWNRVRELPDWGKQIFSPSMIAVGNIQTEKELKELINLAKDSLDYYLANVGITRTKDRNYYPEQNRYCYYQKQNPHVIRSMVNMGIDQKIMEEFVEKVLFPEIY